MAKGKRMKSVHRGTYKVSPNAFSGLPLTMNKEIEEQEEVQ